MSKKNITLIAVLGAVLLLAGGYYWSMNRRSTASAPVYPPYTPPVTLGNLLVSDIVKIEAPGVTLEKNGDIWEVAYIEGGIPPTGIVLDQQRVISMTYSLANVWTELLVDEEPEDLSVFGLDEPSARLVITDVSGQRAEYILGNLTPSRMSYYIMQEGDPAVYTVTSYVGGYIQLDLDSLRQRYIIPYVQPEDLVDLIIESPAHRIEVNIRPESLPLYLESLYASYILTSPYQIPRGINHDTLANLLEALASLEVIAFIDDNPASLRPYGLDNPVRVIFQGQTESLDLLLGDAIDELRYAKFPNAPGVFTVYGAEVLVHVSPFSLFDKFALLVNIQSVESITISGGGRTLYAEIDDRDEDPLFFLNGRRPAEERPFRQFYQALIGLLADAEYRADPNFTFDLNSDENITIEYQLSTPPGGRVSITLLPYNRDFYVLRQEGTMEFLISRNQVRRIYDTADSLVFEE